MKIITTISALAMSSSLTCAFTSTNLPLSTPHAAPAKYNRIDTRVMYYDDRCLDESESNSPFYEDDSNNNSIRIQRLVREHEALTKFAHGEELKNLRLDVQSLKDNLKYASVLDDLNKIIHLKAAIEKAETRDPEIVYAKALQRIEEAKKFGVTKKYRIIAKQTKIAESARKFIPRLNFEGLWVGR